MLFTQTFSPIEPITKISNYCHCGYSMTFGTCDREWIQGFLLKVDANGEEASTRIGRFLHNPSGKCQLLRKYS